MLNLQPHLGVPSEVHEAFIKNKIVEKVSILESYQVIFYLSHINNIICLHVVHYLFGCVFPCKKLGCV